MSHVFISYSASDHDFAELTRMKLENENFTVWMDRADLVPGKEWRRAIDLGISGTKIVLVILTSNSCASPYVTYEWAYALGKGIHVIPLLRQNTEMHPRLEVIQYFDFTDNKNYPWSSLVSRIQSCISVVDDVHHQSLKDLSINEFKNVISSAVSLTLADLKVVKNTNAELQVSEAADSVITAFQAPVASYTGDAKARILWVDDRPDNNALERAALRSMGYEFTISLNTQDAFAKLLEEGYPGYCAIISDMARVEGDLEGYVLLRKLREAGFKTPFFIYTGSHSDPFNREALSRGAQGSTNRASVLFKFITTLR